jgi:hypothetical protein
MPRTCPRHWRRHARGAGRGRARSVHEAMTRAWRTSTAASSRLAGGNTKEGGSVVLPARTLSPRTCLAKAFTPIFFVNWHTLGRHWVKKWGPRGVARETGGSKRRKDGRPSPRHPSIPVPPKVQTRNKTISSATSLAWPSLSCDRTVSHPGYEVGIVRQSAFVRDTTRTRVYVPVSSCGMY